MSRVFFKILAAFAQKEPEDTSAIRRSGTGGAHPLRMPLKGPDRQNAVTEGLHRALRSPGGGPQAIAQTIRRLMVGAVHRKDRAPQPEGQGARRRAYQVQPVSARIWPWPGISCSSVPPKNTLII